VTIYRRPDGFRVYWRGRVDGRAKSRTKDFEHYAGKQGALAFAESLLPELHRGTQSVLSPGQANDALAAIEALQEFYRTTGKRITLRAAVADYVSEVAKLDGHTLHTAVEGFLSTVATVQRMDLTKAVALFIASRKPLTIAPEGKRPQISAAWLYILEKWLEEFAKAFPAHDVCDLTKEHMSAYMQTHGKVSARTRNGRRTAVKMFLKWAVKADYLAPTHRLLEADGLGKEKQDHGEIEFYTPRELRRMLEKASVTPEHAALVPVIALQGLGGLRLQEAARLEWNDVFRIAGHVEISATKSKTRSRRLVSTCASLTAWLNPYRDCSGLVWPHSLETFHDSFNGLLEALKLTPKRNGLRHAYCTYHFAMHANESLTAAQAGNSPQMIHSHYKGLAPKKTAKAWFAVKPAKPENMIVIPQEAEA
jgi:integrase